jgi:phosphate:Na+ symporter
MFLFGMSIMSEGIQKSAGDRLRRTLNFMTGNRFAGMLTGLVVTGIIQSSLAVTVMAVSFVNTGLLTLTQAIGVIMGANIGTTVTAWLVSLIGFSFDLANLALPAVGIGFILSIIKWRYKSLGEFILGFGLLFLGLHYLTQEMGSVNNYINYDAIVSLTGTGFTGVLIGAGVGMVMTFLIHSSSASTAIVLTMAYSNIITYEMAASMVLGANIGTTFDAAFAAIGARTAAKRAALVHILFNVIGTCWALPLLVPLLRLVDYITPGVPVGFGVTTHIAMLHTVFNTINTLLFLPFVNQFARLVSLLIRDKDQPEEGGHYSFAYVSGTHTDTPELNILRAEKEIRDLAGIASSMFAGFRAALDSAHSIPESVNPPAENSPQAAPQTAQGSPLTIEAVDALIAELKAKENLADEMREALTAFLIECTGDHLNPRTEQRVSKLIRIIADLEDMTDYCYSLSIILEKSVRKDHVFKTKEMNALIPYMAQVAEFLDFLQANRGGALTREQSRWAKEHKNWINEYRKKLRKISRKRIEAGKDVKTELLFIDLVRGIERLGDYCYSGSSALVR